MNVVMRFVAFDCIFIHLLMHKYTFFKVGISLDDAGDNAANMLARKACLFSYVIEGDGVVELVMNTLEIRNYLFFSCLLAVGDDYVRAYF